MLYRLSLRFFLISLIASLLLIGVSVVIGGTLPPDLQFLWTAPRQNRWQEMAESVPAPIKEALYSTFRPNVDQWSTVGLYSTGRRLSALRQLPIGKVNGYWNANGAFAVISGQRNGSPRTYQMSFTSNDSRMHWLSTTVYQPISPDGRWLLVYQQDTDGQEIGLKAVPIEQRNQYPPQELTDDEIQSGWISYINWTADSSRFVYGWSQNGSEYKPNELQLIETRLYNLKTHTEEVLDVVDPNLGINFDPSSRYQIRFKAKPQPVPTNFMEERSLRYNAELYDFETGEHQFLSDQMLYYSTWSPDSRYLLFTESTTTLAQRASRVLFGSGSSGWTHWNVLYQPASDTLIPAAETSQYSYSPYYSGWGGSTFGGPIFDGSYGMPFGLRSYTTKTYLFDTQTGEKQEIGSTEQYGNNYYVQWLMNSDRLVINTTNPPAQYSLRPGEEPKLLQFEGENLVTNFSGLRTVATKIEPIPEPSPMTFSSMLTFPYLAPPTPGQPYTTPTYYFVDFETEVIAPMTLEENEMVNGVDFTLNYAGIDVGVMTTMFYNNASSSNTTMSSVYLLTDQGVLKVADQLTNAYPEVFAVSPDEFVLRIVQYSSYGSSTNIGNILHFIRGEGGWQQQNLTADITEWLSWRPKQTDRTTNE